MQENSRPPRKGLDQLIAHERSNQAAVAAVRTLPVDSCLVDGDYVVIHWVFEVTEAAGRVVRIDELAHQRWEGEKVVEERFFYDTAAAAAA